MRVHEALQRRIYELCDERKISINALCQISGVNQSTVSNILGKRGSSPTVSTVQKLCDGLDITIEEFFHSPLFRDLEQEVQ